MRAASSASRGLPRIFRGDDDGVGAEDEKLVFSRGGP